MNKLQESWARAKVELADKPRLRAGVWLGAGIMLVYLLLAQADRLTDAYKEHARQTDGLARLAGVLSRKDWPQLLEEEQRNQQALQAALWRADTSGQAQAQLQQAIETKIEGLGLRDPRIRPGVTQPVPELPGVVRVQVELVGRYSGAAALELLEAIAISPAKLVVDRLVLRRDSGYVEVLLSAYFIGVALDAEERG